MLTPKQRDLLLFIHTRMQATGVPPSFDEMKDALERYDEWLEELIA